VKLQKPLSLFPLQMVLFPGGLLLLKVFEARYLDLVGQCLRNREPFGVVCLRHGAEVGANEKGVRIEETGVLAVIDDVDSEQQGILRVRCTGLQRFRLSEAPVQQANGLWVAAAELLDDDELQAPAETMRATVEALSQAAATLKEKGAVPFVEPMRLDDAGWVANRWCELLPISLAAKQKLMELDDPGMRLQLVDEFLRSRQVVRK
jgi:Lon protease-like protein